MTNPAPPGPATSPTAVDHRDLGRDMRIFDSSPLVGPGLPLWLPAGAAIRHELEKFAREIAVRSGCEPVYSPVLGKRSLYERSGHWDKFAQDIFPPLDDGSGDPLVLRPANCPHHAQIYASEPRSYRDLPVRYHELAPMFRAERSGVVSGLRRVRQINLDDTHVFCRPDQVESEVRIALAAVLEAFSVLGIDIAYLRLSRRDESDAWLGRPEQWAHAEASLRSALADAADGLAWREDAGEAAFYGPKIDVQVIDVHGHEETLATVQLDFNQPERFDLSYVGDSGERERAIMIHRGTVGSMERIVAFLLERHAGRLPFWLAPVQLCLLPVADHDDAGLDFRDRLVADLRTRDLRVRVDADGSLGNRVRLARRRRDALLGVIGPAELDAGMVAVQDPATGARALIPANDIGDLLERAARSRASYLAL